MGRNSKIAYCPTCAQPQRDEHDRLLVDDEGASLGRAVMGFDVPELVALIGNNPPPTLLVRLLRALRLLDAQRAQVEAQKFGLAFPASEKSI